MRSTATNATRVCALAFAFVWVLTLGMLQWSVVRFAVPILLTLSLAACALIWWQVRRAQVEVSLALGAVIVAVSVAVTWAVPLFSYLTGDERTFALSALTVGGLACATALARGGTDGGRAAYVMAVITHLIVSAIVIVSDRAPQIDVWVITQQASDALARGENFYAMTWDGSPGVQDAFTYLPWTAVLLAPGRWIAGDVRVALAVWTVLMCAGIWALGRGSAPWRSGQWLAGQSGRAAVPICLLVFAPGTITQIDQAWTEPLLAAGLVWWAVLVQRGHAWWAVVPLALACASKQHLALLVPVLMAWRPFGVSRTLAAGALTGALVAPWVIASPADFFRDTVALLVNFHPIRFANTWYLYFLNEHGVTLPFWVTGLVVLTVVVAAAVAVHRRQPGVDEVLRWCALVLLVASLVNKQAFYNQFWLCAALVATSLAVPTLASVSGSASVLGSASLSSKGAQLAQPGAGESLARGA